MKIFTIIISVFAIAFNATAQIPNNGFENWTSFGNYEDPMYWGSTNSYSSGPFYAVIKSTDHYPESVGNYSIRLENNIALNPNYPARGGLFSGPPPPGPDFPVTGHPLSLTGYYKFAPMGGDTMCIFIQLYSNGSTVSNGLYTSTVAATDWTSFNIPLENYTNADSASVILAAYNANGFNYIPHGNSVLYVDNLNFDELITSVDEPVSTSASLSLYPDPASDIVSLNIDNKNNSALTVDIYTITGELVMSEILKQNQQQVNISDLSNGTYVVAVKSKELNVNQKLIIQH